MLQLTLLAVLALGPLAGVGGEDAVPAARAMLAACQGEPARIDRARAVPETVLLSPLTGSVRQTTMAMAGAD